MAMKSYRTYRGRTPRWKKVLTAVLLLILAGALAFLLLQRYQVFDSNGPHFQLPFFSERENDTSGSENEDDYDEDLIINIVDDPNQQPEQDPNAADDTEELTQKAEAQLLHGRAVAAAAAQQGDFSALREGECPVITLKAPNEALILDHAGTAEALTAQLKDRDAVVRLACYADSDKAKHNEKMALMSVKGRAWGDPGGKSYLNPYQADVTAYLRDMVQRSAALGVSEVLLDNVTFPTVGRLGNITFGGQTDTPETRIAAINGFLDQMREALGDQTLLSVSLPVSLLQNPVDGVAGLDLKAIVQRVDRVYMRVEDQAQADAARASFAALCPDVDSESAFVAVVSQPVTGGSYMLING